MDKKGLLIVMARVKPEDEGAFNQWYNEDHLPQAIERLPGVLSGRQYKIRDREDEYQYLAMDGFESCMGMHATAGSVIMKEVEREFDAAFGKGGGKRSLAGQVKALTVG